MVKFLHKALPAFLILASQFVVAQTAQTWTLEKCIDYALRNNLQIKQAEVTAKLSSSDNLQSKLNLLPIIDANASFSNNFGNGFNPQTYSFAEGNSQSLQLQLTGSVPIFTGLQQLYNIQRTRYDLLASKFDFEAAKNNVCLNVASAYLQILLNKEIVRVAEKQHTLTQNQHDIVQARIKAGAMPETSIYDIDAQLGRDEVTIVNAKNAVSLAMLGLQQLLQIKEDSTFDIDAPEVKTENMSDIAAISSGGVYNYALQNQPSIKSADARVASAEVSRKISYGALSPTLSAFASLSSGYFSQDKKVLGYNYDTLAGTITYQGTEIPFSTNSVIPVNAQYGNYTFGEELHNNFRKVIGLSLDIPLFSRGQKIINIQKAKLQTQLRQLQLDAAKNQLRQDIEQAYTNAKAAAESFLANQRSLTSSQKAYQATETRYKAGMASNFDIEQAQSNLVAAESEMVKAKYTYVFRIKILDFYQGKPITLN